MITIHQRYRQTDRQTDRQTTCDRNTALCTKVHRAVKMDCYIVNLMVCCVALIVTKVELAEVSSTAEMNLVLPCILYYEFKIQIKLHVFVNNVF